jgi:hypothetical protein
MSEFCEPHFRRTGEKIPAVRVVAGTPMCLGCFKGSAIDPPEEHFGLPFFLADVLTGSKGQAQAHDNATRKGEVA